MMTLPRAVYTIQPTSAQVTSGALSPEDLATRSLSGLATHLEALWAKNLRMEVPHTMVEFSLLDLNLEPLNLGFIGSSILHWSPTAITVMRRWTAAIVDGLRKELPPGFSLLRPQLSREHALPTEDALMYEATTILLCQDDL